MSIALVAGLAAGALGFFLGGLGKDQKKEQPNQPEPDPRLDRIMQSQQRQEGLLNQILQNQMLGGGSCLGCLGNAAALQGLFGGCRTPSQFFSQTTMLFAYSRTSSY